MRLQIIICHKKSFFAFAFFYETRANTQQPVQTGLYRYDENKWCNILALKTLTDVNLVR